MLQTDRHVISWDAIARALRPLDEHQRILGQDFVPTNVRELGRVAQAIQIEMEYRRSRGGVSMHESEGRTRHVLCHAVTLADCPHQRGLSSAKFSRDCYQ